MEKEELDLFFKEHGVKLSLNGKRYSVSSVDQARTLYLNHLKLKIKKKNKDGYLYSGREYFAILSICGNIYDLDNEKVST